MRRHPHSSSPARRRRPVVVAALLTTASAMLAAPVVASAATLYVDPAAASAAPGSGCGAAAAYQSICLSSGYQQPCAPGTALAAASPGDTIEVCAGTYTEHIEILQSGIALRGAKAGIPAGPDPAPAGRGTGESVIVRPAGINTSVIHLAVGGITGDVIDGFTIQTDSQPAINDNPNGCAGGSHLWTNNIIQGIDGVACGAAAINLNHLDASQILDNRITGCAIGISVQSGCGTDAPSLIEGNYIANQTSSGHGVIMSAGNAPGHVIRGNHFDHTLGGNSSRGVVVQFPDAQIVGNTFTHKFSAMWLLNNGHDALIQDNVVHDGGYGGYIFARGATFTGNDYRNNDRYGIYLGTYDHEITGNDFDGNRYNVYQSASGAGAANEIHGNNIENSLFGGVVRASGQDVEAQCNWWGSADGPAPTGSGDSVSAGVNYVPSLVAPVPGGACTGPVFDDEGPVTSDVVLAPNPAPVDTPVDVSAVVDDTDTGGSDIDSAEYSVDGGPWNPMAADDGSFDSVAEIVAATVGSFSDAGVHEVCVRGTDAYGNTGAAECAFLAVYDPSAGFVTGGGWIWSPAGAYRLDTALEGKASFGFVAKYKKGANVPDGNTEFQFKAGDLNFKSTDYDWLVVAGANAKFKGSGTINGSGDYGFMVTATDSKVNGGGNVDSFRIKIWDHLAGDGVVYDNKFGDPDSSHDGTELGGGNIVVHKGK